jgi:hypothetical protein
MDDYMRQNLAKKFLMQFKPFNIFTVKYNKKELSGMLIEKTIKKGINTLK